MAMASCLFSMSLVLKNGQLAKIVFIIVLHNSCIYIHIYQNTKFYLRE